MRWGISIHVELTKLPCNEQTTYLPTNKTTQKPHHNPIQVFHFHKILGKSLVNPSTSLHLLHFLYFASKKKERKERKMISEKRASCDIVSVCRRVEEKQDSPHSMHSLKPLASFPFPMCNQNTLIQEFHQTSFPYPCSSIHPDVHAIE